MNDPRIDDDPVIARLASLPISEPPAALSRSIRSAAYDRLAPRPVHAIWTAALVAAAVSYLGWALRFAGSLY
jgi:hypothetical protein